MHVPRTLGWQFFKQHVVVSIILPTCMVIPPWVGAMNISESWGVNRAMY